MKISFSPSFGIFLLLLAMLATGCDSTPAPSAGVTKSTEPAKQSSGDQAATAEAEENSLAAAQVSWSTATPNSELSGKIDIDGSSTVYPITEAVAAAFKKLYENVNITVGKSGTGGGFKRFTVGETDISDASRPIKDTEFKACHEHKISFIELPIAYDGLTIVVHKENDFVDQLTVEQLQTIFLSDKAAKTWKDLDSAWPDTVIKIFAPGTDSGTFDYFKEVVAGKDGAIRSDMSTSENDDVLVNGVAGDTSAIGFFGAAYYFQNMDKLKAVKIINPETGKPTLPSDETIKDGTYAPFSRPLFIYLNQNSVNKAQVEKFVDFYLAHAAEFARQVGYVALPDEVYQQAYDNYLEDRIGTHYMTDSMEKRSGPVTEVYHPANLHK
jgi:phosphate transport system substrate-binding protein